MALTYTIFPEKLILKWNKELVELHKRVIKTYLSSKGVKYTVQVKFFKLYDYYIDERNIKSYFFTPTSILVQSLVLNRVDQVSIYIYHKSNGKRKRKSHSNKR